MNNKIKTVFKGLFCIFMYFFITFFQGLPFEIMNVDTSNIPSYLMQIYNLIWDIFLILLIILVFKEEIQNSWNDMKKNHLNYFKKYFKYYVIALIVMMVGNAYIFSINGGNIAGNESNVRDLFAVAPIYTYISAVILAPILEELVFRLSLKNVLGNNWLFILSSGLIFGGIHIISSYTSPMDLLYLIPYGSFGVAFGYILVKSKNIFVSMGFHFMHNGIIMALQIFLLLFS